MAGAAGSLGSIAQLNKSQQTHSLFHHGKKAAKAGKALGNQQQFASLLAAKQTTLSNSIASNASSPTANGGNSASNTSSALATANTNALVATA